VNVLHEQGWLSRQPADFRDAMLGRARRLRYSARDFVYHLDDPPAGIYGIATGTFSLLAAPERGEPRLGHVLHRGAWFGEGPLLTGRRRRLAVQARTAGEVAYVSVEDVNVLCEAHPAWHRFLAVLAFEHFAVAASVVSDLQLRGSEARLAAGLLRAAGRTVLAPEAELFPVRLSQSELGEMANVSRQVVNATLRRWQEAGLIAARYGEVRVVDVERLLERVREREPPPER
jgi:CRP-like cAMP-binding protein